MTSDKSGSRQIIIALALFCAAFLLRLIYLLQMKGDPLFVNLIGGDSIYYDFVARMIIEGNWSDKTAFLHSPLYRYFLVVLYSLFGRDLDVVRYVQAVLGSVNAVLVYFIGKRIFNETVGLIAGIMMALYRIFFFFEGLLLPDSILPFLCLLTILAVIIACETMNYKRWVIAGACLGLCAITRPNMLLFFPFTVLWVLLKTHASWRKTLLSSVSLSIGAMLIISPITLRNYLIERDFVLITAAGGLNFYIGNNPYTEGSYYLPEGMSFRIGDPFDDFYGRKIAEEANGNKKLTTPQISNYWLRRGLAFVREEPAAAAKLFARKWLLLINSYEIPQPDDFYAYQVHAPILRLPLPTTAVVMPLGILGIFLSFKPGRKSLVLHFFIFSYALSIVIFFIVARYRLPLLPFMTIFTAYSISWMIETLRVRRFERLSGAVLALFLLFVFCNPGVKVALAHSYGTATATSTATATGTATASPSSTATATSTGTPRPIPTMEPLVIPSGLAADWQQYACLGSTILVVLCCFGPLSLAVLISALWLGTRSARLRSRSASPDYRSR